MCAISNRFKSISLLALPLLLSLAIPVQASLVSIHTPKRDATVPIGPLTVSGTAIQSNSTLKDCAVQVKTDKAPYDNATPISAGNFSKWSFVSNQTSPGINQIEAQLKCVKQDGSFLIHHSVHNVTVTASAEAKSPFVKAMAAEGNINQTLKQLANDENNTNIQSANLTNQLVPKDFVNPTGNFSRPIQGNLENITGALPPPIPIHKNATIPTPSRVNATVQPSINNTSPPQTSTKAVSTTNHGLSIISMSHVTGHHKTIHIHFSH